MTSDDPVIAALSDANPVPRTHAPGPPERAEADRVRHRVMSSPAPSRNRPAVLVPVLSTLVVLAVVAVLVRSGGASHSAAPYKRWRSRGSFTGQASSMRRSGSTFSSRASP